MKAKSALLAGYALEPPALLQGAAVVTIRTCLYPSMAAISAQQAAHRYAGLKYGRAS